MIQTDVAIFLVTIVTLYSQGHWIGGTVLLGLLAAFTFGYAAHD